MKSFRTFIMEGEAKKANRIYGKMLAPDANTPDSDPSDEEPDTPEDIKRRQILNKAVGAGTSRSGEDSGTPTS